MGKIEIKNIKVMRGPNYWSRCRNKLIVLKLNVSEWENILDYQMDWVKSSLERVMPTLKWYRFLENLDGDKLDRLDNSVSIGQVVQHVAVELQNLAGIDCDYGKTIPSYIKGEVHVIISYVIEKAGVYAAKTAVELVGALINGMDYKVEEDIQRIKQLYFRYKLGPSTYAIVKEAERRNIPHTRLNNNSLVMFGQGCNQKVICASVACSTSSIAVDMVSDKDVTRNILSQSHIPVPKGVIINEISELEDAVNEIGFPLVTKPINGNHGRGITTCILSMEQARLGFNKAQMISEDIIVERYIRGLDYRFLVINFKLVAVARRTPAMVMGDGISSIFQLIDETNNDLRRGDGHEKGFTKIKVDDSLLTILNNNCLTLDSVLPIGEILFLSNTANLSTGGTSEDVTDQVHPYNIFLAERIARIMNLDICGIDIIADDVKVPICEKNGAVLEVNAGPGLRMHLSPAHGSARNVAEPIVNMLYPENANARIPIVAVTGTNGKTTVTRLIAHIAQTAGRHTGFTTTDGICIDGKDILYGDCSGPTSAAAVLRDPIVDYAVFECARGGILRAGLGFDKCNISVVTNISEDHLGLNDIYSLEQLAKVKAVVPQSTFNYGYAVLNADDDMVYAIKDSLKCKIALFSMISTNVRIKEHCRNGGLAAFVEEGYFVISKGEWKSRVAVVTQIPLSFEGKCAFMVNNILPALLVASISNFPMEAINTALLSFIPSPEQTPGRMNLFQFNKFRLMVDYVHNTGGFIQIEKYMNQVRATRKTGIISATGDRREEDIKNIGRFAAKIFDRIIIKHDRDNRGRTVEELSMWLLEGIREINNDISVVVISNELESIQFAIENTVDGEFVFVCADDIPQVLSYVSKRMDRERPSNDLMHQQTIERRILRKR